MIIALKGAMIFFILSGMHGVLSDKTCQTLTNSVSTGFIIRFNCEIATLNVSKTG